MAMKRVKPHQKAGKPVRGYVAKTKGAKRAKRGARPADGIKMPRHNPEVLEGDDKTDTSDLYGA